MEQTADHFLVRRADMSQLDEMMEIYGKARKFMAEHGNPTQWTPDYPPRDMVSGDIQAGRMYVCMLGQKIGAVFYYHAGEETDYKNIWNGRWLDEEPYGVVHRIASAGNVRGAGSFCLIWALEQCGNLKIDTHRDNIVMQNLLKKLGFQYCGLIRGRDGGERLAYQKKRV